LVITIATRNQVNPSADTRFAVSVSALRLLSSHDVPFPGAASLRADAPGHGLSMRMVTALSLPTQASEAAAVRDIASCAQIERSRPTLPTSSPSASTHAPETVAAADGLPCRQTERSKPPSRAAALSPPIQATEAVAGGDSAACGQIERSGPSLRYASMSMVVALQSPGSRRSVAPHRLCAPPPPRYSPALPRGCNRPPGPRSAAAPSADSHPLPSAPLGLPLRLRAAPDDRFAATGATLRLKGAPDSRLTPPSSESGGRRRSFSFRSP